MKRSYKVVPGKAFSSNSKGPRASLVAQLVKNLPAAWETGCSPWVGVRWGRERLPSPVFLPGKF